MKNVHVGFLFVAMSFHKKQIQAKDFKKSLFSFLLPREKILLTSEDAETKCPALLSRLHDSHQLADGFTLDVPKEKILDAQGLISRNLIHPDILVSWDLLFPLLVQAESEGRITWRTM